MPFDIVRNDITAMQVDAIVNSANPQPVVGAGVDSAIHAAAGPALLRKRQQIGALAVGQAAISKGYDLPAKYVIHAVGPVWQDGAHREREMLRLCYQNALELARRHRCRSVAFPLISAGAYGFPRGEAMEIALSAISAFLMQHEMTVYLVVYDKASYLLSEKLFKEVQSYIDEKSVVIPLEDEERRLQRRRMAMEDMAAFSLPLEDARPSMVSAAPAAPKKKARRLEELMGALQEPFSTMLLRLIDEKGRDEVEVYKRANVDRKLFSKIRSNPDYHPKKQTAIAFAIALELNLDETRDLLARAGFTLSRSSKFDIIIEFFIEQGNYDIFEINEVLFAFDQPLIGA